MVTALLGDVQNQGFAAGVLVSLEKPTPAMEIEAAQAGKFSTVAFGDYPKLQLLTVGELLAGARVLYPLQAAETFKTAVKGGKKEAPQIGLDL